MPLTQSYSELEFRDLLYKNLGNKSLIRNHYYNNLYGKN